MLVQHKFLPGRVACSQAVSTFTVLLFQSDRPTFKLDTRAANSNLNSNLKELDCFAELELELEK